MKVHKIELLVFDFEDYGVDRFKPMLNDMKYIMANVMSTSTVEIEGWTDDHPLNKHATQHDEYYRIFPTRFE